MKRFQIGRVVSTRGIYERMKKESEFAAFIFHSLALYAKCDWGNTCEMDKKSNDEAVESGDLRILAAYVYPKTGEQIWIITEADRSVTTILYPSEY